MPGLCGREAGSTTVQDKEIGTGCGVKEAPVGCTSRKELARIPPPEIPGLYLPQLFDTCVCNEMIALRGRVLADVPRPTRLGLEITERALRRISRQIGTTMTISEDEFVDKYVGGKRARYKAALKSLRQIPVTPRDAIISAFIKPEKFNPADKKTAPDPRLIQCRSPRFNIACGKYLRDIEHRVYNLKQHGLKVMGKGMTPQERGANVHAKWKRFKQPVALAIDASRFDQHVSLEMLRLEHQFYLRCNNNSEFETLLKCQERNVGYTKHGIRYNTVGRRMSGDLNTAVGNCVLMYAMTKGLLKHAGLQKYDLCVDGDDTIIIIEQAEEHKLANLTDLFLMVGHEIKLERRSTQFEGIQWCQSRMCFMNDQPVSVRGAIKVLSCTCAGTQYWGDPRTQKEIMHAVGLGMRAENRGVPILQKFAEKLVSMSNTKIKNYYDIIPLNGMAYDVMNRYTYNQLLKIEGIEVSLASRTSYHLAWGITPAEQIEMEHMIDIWDVRLGEIDHRCTELQRGWRFESHPLDHLP